MATPSNRKGLEKKIVTSIISVGVVPMLMVLIIGFFAMRAVIWQTGKEVLESRVLNLADAIETEIKIQVSYGSRSANRYRLRRLLRSWTDEPSGELAARYNEYIEDWKERAYDYNLISVNILDETGRQLAPVIEGETITYADEPWWNAAAESTEGVVAELAPDPEHEGFHTRILAPIRGETEGEIYGYVHLLIDMGAMDRIRRPETSPTDDTYLVIGSRDNPEVYDLWKPGKSAPVLTRDAGLVDVVKEKGQGSIKFRWPDEGSFLVGFAPMNISYSGFSADAAGSAMYVMLRRPVHVVFGGIYKVSAFTLLGGAVLLGIFCLREVRRIHNNIVRPVSLLNEGAQIIGQGDLELKLKIHTNDEIEELAASFNRMAVDLKANIHQLAESERKYRELVTSMKEGIYQTDLAGVITYVNPAAGEILGCADPDELLDNRFDVFFMDEADVAWFKSSMQNAGAVAGYRCWMRWHDGEPICVELSASQVQGQDGQTVGTEGIFRDVTQRVELEREAREKADRISVINEITNAINSSLNIDRVLETVAIEVRKLIEFDEADLMLVTDKKGEFEHYRLWPVYERIAEMRVGAGSPVEWVVENKERIVISEVDRAVHPDVTGEMASKVVLPLVIQDNVVGAFELGSVRPGAFTQSRIEVLEQVAAQLAVAVQNAKLFADIENSFEDVKRAREDLARANEELKSLDTMKTNLLSNVSHELRTPLVSIMGYTDMIFNEKAGFVNPVQKEYLGISLRNIDRLVTLIENLLDFSRLHRGTEALVFETIDLVDVAKASVEILRPSAAKRKITIEIDSTVPEFKIDGDSGKMGQVFNNLLSNAVKFNKDKGHVWVRLAKSGPDSVEVSVRDTGIGIPEDELNEVFTRFYQCDSSSTRKYGGTGIGLNIAQDVVRLHGGRITVTSKKREGSTFRFTLPLSRPEVYAVPEREPSVPQPHIVEVVTGNADLRSSVKMYCDRDEISLINASSADDAITLARRHRPDCILVDADVCDNMAADLFVHVKRGVTKSIPIILISNEPGPDNYDETEYIATRLRPNFSRASLLRSIKYALDPRRKRQPPTGKEILVVDDDPEVIEFVRNCLDAEGYTVNGLTSGQETIEEIRRGDYGMVLLDVAMPDMDGWNVCRDIKDDPVCANVHVCMVTARPESEVEAQIGSCGADGYMLKPFRSDDLVTCVTQVVQESSRARARVTE